MYLLLQPLLVYPLSSNFSTLTCLVPFEAIRFPSRCWLRHGFFFAIFLSLGVERNMYVYYQLYWAYWNFNYSNFFTIKDRTTFQVWFKVDKLLLHEWNRIIRNIWQIDWFDIMQKVFKFSNLTEIYTFQTLNSAGK